MSQQANKYTRNHRVRPDGAAKVTGELKYLTDLKREHMLYGKIVRSAYPHANILSINTKDAEQLPGVEAVITYKDVPGLNGFGIVMPDQPVLCQDKVRYVGDAVAAVAAKSPEIAERAVKLIRVEYDPLPTLDSPEKALEVDAPLLHQKGNILHQASYQKGDVEKGFEKCIDIVEQTYHVPRQMHTYMETEGGVIVPEANGAITVLVGTQHGYKDRFQLSRILNIPEEKIRIVSSPIGGSFGGKDELNIQPYAAILALKTARPVKIHQTRKESVISGIKRHPMKITMKTGVDEHGKIIAHQVKIIADTGAYSTLGPAVLDFAVEHATGPYVIENVNTEGVSVFTNNGVSGEFRGFGGNQVAFALEGQIDRLAEKLQMDPIDFRRMNLRKRDDVGPLGHRIAKTNGASEVLEGIASLYQDKKTNQEPERWKKRGTGIAITMHGGGLGYGRLDPAGGRLSLNEDGKIEIAFGFEEFGQGILAVIEMIVTEELGVSADDLSIVIGDTSLVPPSGSTTASRGTSMVWHAVQRMKTHFTEEIIQSAAKQLNISQKHLRMGKGGIYSDQYHSKPLLTYKQLVKHTSSAIVTNTSFDFPTTPDEVDGGHFLYTFSGVMAQVEIDLLTGKVKVIDLDQVIAAGPVVNKIGYRGQIEGGGVMSLGYTLMEEAFMQEGKYITENLDSYLIPSIQDVPFALGVEAIESLDDGDVYGPRGVGEIGSVAVAPAITKAVHNAIGYWANKLPISSEEILNASGKRSVTSWMKVGQ
ncbi:xanthine dehydrogenase subunit D [Aquibacillus albus]|uniref:Xanthine dehydrogenase D subunit n=1 Tax=Aquibacillus albus TaxID=1168171 RepID=A0ABS2MZ24_9BACI|nr:xanthine dehydrogenase D subunit [Aquibacillus albus]